MPPVSGIVVAGGHSRRLGTDKRRLRLWGPDRPTLLEHTLSVLAPLCAELLVVLNDPDAWAGLPARLIPDVYADGGAAGGIYAGLAAASQPYAIVVAADMPFLNANLLRAMLAYPRTYDLLVPRSPQPGATRNALNIEPLHAIYNHTCLQPLRANLEQGQRQISALLDQVQVAIIEPDVINRYDAQGYAFLNINTPDDVALARQVITPSSFS